MGSTNHHGRFSFDPASFQYNYSRDHGMTGTEAAANTLTGGLFVNSFTGEVNRRRAQAQYDAEQRAQDAATAQRNQNIEQLRAAFGVGQDPNAAANAKRLGDYLDQYYKAYLTNQLGQVDNQYTSATRASRQNLARVGQLGSGLDASNQTQTLSDYLKARQGAVANAAAARESLNSQLQGQRQSLESQISSGAVVNPDFNSYIAQQLATIDAAKSQIPSNTVGTLFKVAGQAYNNGQTNYAVGNQGLSAFFGGGGGGTSGGRIS